MYIFFIIYIYTYIYTYQPSTLNPYFLNPRSSTLKPHHSTIKGVHGLRATCSVLFVLIRARTGGTWSAFGRGVRVPHRVGCHSRLVWRACGFRGTAPSLSFSLSLSLTLSVYLSLCFSVSLSPCFSLSLPLCLCLSASLSLSLYFSV